MVGMLQKWHGANAHLSAGGMTFGTERCNSSSGYDYRRLPPNAQQTAWGGVTLASVAALCAWTLCSALGIALLST